MDNKNVLTKILSCEKNAVLQLKKNYIMINN